jgi:hypothetical protein
MSIMFGSARIGENGKVTDGAKGDQKQTSSINDTKGEVSIQVMYKHVKGWLVFRPKTIAHANKIAERMTAACNNSNIGYNQNERLGIVTNGIDTKVKTNADCSSTVRECIKEATGKDVGNFTTANEASILKASGLFEDSFEYVSQEKTPVYNGDVLVTKTKGHTGIICSGNPRIEATKTKSENYKTPEPTLKKGSAGTQVKYLQIALNKLIKAGLVVDGDFGSKTQKALINWQSSSALTADGIYGELSQAQMKKQLAKYN